METTPIDELNKFLKGIYMAMDSYDRYISSIDDQTIRNELRKIKDDHIHHSDVITSRILELGGEPVRSVGFMGKIGEVMAGIKDAGKHDKAYYLKSALDGEEKGIEMSSELVRGELDSRSMELVQNILDIDRKHLDTLNGLIQSSNIPQ